MKLTGGFAGPSVALFILCNTSTRHLHGSLLHDKRVETNVGADLLTYAHVGGVLHVRVSIVSKYV